ncbi:LpxL/LpxP family acyltransferase [Marilutibacter alkalisoli]|uniref:Acyltransferase n=1 Tax=Marilutibacter alkalisoli TaxID=2591633 RepID=A0A514BP67_9GAMM|nr:acyltransferase [Lysobacter alkalisoli]QDH68809.1 acyltransferase [Lysobacter alkalisoli]
MSTTTPASGNGDWTRRPEGGGRVAFWLIGTFARRFGRTPARLLLYPITLYYLAMRGPERRASRAYLERILGRRARLRDVARHIHTFAATILDRVFLLCGRFDDFEIAIEGLEALVGRAQRGEGMLLFGSHLGSFEALRALAAKHSEVQLRIVLDKQHNPALTGMLDALNPELARNIIDAGQDGPSIVLAIRQAIDDGAMVAVLADRVRPGETVEPVPFLGAPAPFPLAPWLIAAVLGAPVVLVFGLYQGGRRYRLVFEPFNAGGTIARRERERTLSQWVHRYAARLESHARSAPFNWFNFYDFWQNDDARIPPTAVAGATAHDDASVARGAD